MLANIEWNRKRAQFLIGNSASRCNAVAKHSFSLRQSRLPPFFSFPSSFIQFSLNCFFRLNFFLCWSLLFSPRFSHTLSLSLIQFVFLDFFYYHCSFFFFGVIIKQCVSFCVCPTGKLNIRQKSLCVMSLRLF